MTDQIPETIPDITGPSPLRVVGVTFEGRQGKLYEVWNKNILEAYLIRQPHNTYDDNAIGVFAGPHQIGFLPKELAAIWAPEMDQRGIGAVRARLGYVGGGYKDDGNRLNIGARVFALDPDEWSI